MAHARGPRAGGRFDPSAAVDEIVADWLHELAAADDGVVRTPRLLAGYEALARAAIAGGLRAADAGDEWSADQVPLDRLLAETAAAVRRSRLTISQSLGDLDRLGPIILRRIARAPHATGTEEALDAVARLLDGLGGVSRRLTDVLQASAVRHRRERTDTLAALTDQLSHELQNRLGAAQTAADMLLDPAVELDESGLAEVAHLVRVSVDAALRTVDDVRDLVASRSEIEEPVARPAPEEPRRAACRDPDSASPSCARRSIR